MIRYLITHKDYEPFLTHWFDFENLYSKGQIVYDLQEARYTIDGKTWLDIGEDHL